MDEQRSERGHVSEPFMAGDPPTFSVTVDLGGGHEMAHATAADRSERQHPLA